MKRIVIAVCVLMLLTLSACGKGEKSSAKIEPATVHVQVEGITKSYKLLFVTDSHVVVKPESGPEQMKQYAEERYPQFLNSEGTDARDMFEAMISYSCSEEVDAVVLGGDIIDSPSEENIAFLQEQLARIEGKYLYTPGNHDWTFPWEYMSSEGKEELLPKLTPFMEGNTAVHFMNLDELTIVAVDDSTNQVNAEALQAYRSVLSEKKPVIVVTHVPFITQSTLTKAREAWSSPTVIGGGNFGGIYPDENSQEFMNLTTAEDSPVQLILAGHVHFQDEDVVAGPKSVRQIVGKAGYLGGVTEVIIEPKE